MLGNSIQLKWVEVKVCIKYFQNWRFEDIRKQTETSRMNTWTEKQAANGWRDNLKTVYPTTNDGSIITGLDKQKFSA